MPMPMGGPISGAICCGCIGTPGFMGCCPVGVGGMPGAVLAGAPGPEPPSMASAR